MWGTEKRGQFSFELRRRSGHGSEESFHDQLLAALTGELGDAVIESGPAAFTPDLCLKLPGMDRLAVIELKVGDPTLPLPSSTAAQMRRFVENVDSAKTENPPTPVVVTNYLVDENQEKELAANNIRLVRVGSEFGPKVVAESLKSALISK